MIMTTARLMVCLHFLFRMHRDLLRVEQIASFTWSNYERSMRRWMGTAAYPYSISTRRAGFLGAAGWVLPTPASSFVLSSGYSAVHYDTARTVSVHSARKKGYLVSLLSLSARQSACRSAALYKKDAEDLLELSQTESEEDDFPSSCLVGWQAPQL